MTESDELFRARLIEEQVGHPGDMWEALKVRVKAEELKQFSSVQDAWLSIMWALDEYRRQGVPPREMGKATVQPAARLAAINRSKGNYFAELVALLLEHRTNQTIRPRTKVRGFSQFHQVDLAWPSREEDPLLCVETKVTGAPAYGSTPSRSAVSDFSNRRKELKFAATDLKLWRRQQETEIRHWGVWRETAPPQTYFLWAARLRTDRARGNDTVEHLVREAQALVNTYLEGAGIFCWRESSDHYESVPIPPHGQVTALDDVLYRIESQIKHLAPRGAVPAPQRPSQPVVDVDRLAEDSAEYGESG